MIGEKKLEFIEAGIDLFRDEFNNTVNKMMEKQAEDEDVTLKVSIHIDQLSGEPFIKTTVAAAVPDKSKVEFKTLPGQYRLDYDDNGARIVDANEDQEQIDGWEGEA